MNLKVCGFPQSAYRAQNPPPLFLKLSSKYFEEYRRQNPPFIWIFFFDYLMLLMLRHLKYIFLGERLELNWALLRTPGSANIPAAVNPPPPHGPRDRLRLQNRRNRRHPPRHSRDRRRADRTMDLCGLSLILLVMFTNKKNRFLETTVRSMEEIISCIFELYKTDIPLNSSQKPSLNIGAFLQVKQPFGL